MTATKLWLMALLLFPWAACGDGDAPGDVSWSDVVAVDVAPHRPFAVTADPSHLYWIEFTEAALEPNRIFRMPRTGGATELLHASTAGLQDLEVDGDSLYFLEGEGVFQIPVTGGTPTRLADNGGGESLVLHGGRLFWAGAATGAGLLSVRTDGTDVQVHSAERARHRIAVSDAHVYFASEDGDVLAQPWPSADPAVTVGEDDCATDVALGPAQVYWLHRDSCQVTGGETLRRAPRAAAAAPEAAEDLLEGIYGLEGDGREVFTVDPRHLWRVTDGAPRDVASVSDVTCHQQGSVGSCFGPTDVHIDPLGVFLCGWYGADSVGRIGFVARP